LINAISVEEEVRTRTGGMGAPGLSRRKNQTKSPGLEALFPIHQ